MIKSIVVAVDGSAYSAAARDEAIVLARTYQARLVGLHVLDVRVLEMPLLLSSAYTVAAPPPSNLSVEILDSFRENGDRVLQDFVQAVAPSGLPVEVRLEEGVPASTIAEIAEAHDFLVMGKRGAHARWGDEVIGSTAEQVVRRAGSPVLLTDRDAPAFLRLGLLYDGSHPANEALKLAADLASHLPASMLVLTAGADLEEAGEVQREARDYLSAFDLPVDYRVSDEDAVTSALAALEAEPVDLVVLGRHSHSRLRSFILGSTTQELLHRLTSPLLVTA